MKLKYCVHIIPFECKLYYRSANKYMRGIYLCAFCESLPDRIIKLRTNFSRTKLS